MRILSGIQPSGALHLGNYCGAIRQHIALQAQGECFYFIADYHALTTLKDPEALRRNTLDAALTYLAFGLDPARTTFFKQSDVPQVTELTWLLATVTGQGFLERAHSFKDKEARGLPTSVGLFLYPVLMAADILIYRSHLVPVGQDQVQHVEMARDMAGFFNRQYGELFPLPEYRLDVAPKVPGTDGEKMSKSYDNALELDLTGQELRRKVMAIKTDSTPVEAPKDPEKCTVFALYALLADEAERRELAEKYRAGGYGYGEAKKLLAQKIEEYFAEYRQKRAELAGNLDYVEQVLREGGARARAEAEATMVEVRRAVGLR